MKIHLLLILSAIFSVWGCIKAPDYPIEPVIEFAGLTKDTLQQDQFNTDSLIVVMTFTDGDGDLGSDNEVNVFVTDLRDGFISDRFRIPRLDDAGSNNGISGEIYLTLYTTCCTYPNGAPPCEPSTQFPTNKLSYEIYIMDQAGNKSNVITTPEITLRCD